MASTRAAASPPQRAFDKGDRAVYINSWMMLAAVPLALPRPVGLGYYVLAPIVPYLTLLVLLHPPVLPANIVTSLRGVAPSISLLLISDMAEVKGWQAALVSALFVGLDLIDGPLARRYDAEARAKAKKAGGGVMSATAARESARRRNVGAALDLETDAFGMFMISLVVAHTVWTPAIIPGLFRYLWCVVFPGKKHEEDHDKPKRGRLIPMICAGLAGVLQVLAFALDSREMAAGAIVTLAYSFGREVTWRDLQYAFVLPARPR